MPEPANNGGSYAVVCSQAITKRLERIQKQAKDEGRGERVLSAMRQIWKRLSTAPSEFGEPLYHLPALRLQVRHGVARPLLIYFAVHQDRPLVFIKDVTLLPSSSEK